MAKNAVFYIDGWNLFTQIDKLDEPSLKWTSLWDLANRMIPKRDEKLVAVKFFWAHLKSVSNVRSGRFDRQQTYVKALTATGVECRLAYFNKRKTVCKRCQNTWERPEEKETDVAIGVELLLDASLARVDVAYLVSADGDLAPAAKALAENFKSVELVTVAPPHMYHSAGIKKYAPRKMKITPEQLRSSLLPANVPHGGNSAIERPAEYAPPVPVET